MRLIKLTVLVFTLCTISLLPFSLISDDGMKTTQGITIISAYLHAQDNQRNDASNMQENKTANGQPGVIYQVMIVVLVIWSGLSIFIFRLDRKLSKLEKKMQNAK